jgi:hypothetical protein
MRKSLVRDAKHAIEPRDFRGKRALAGRCDTEPPAAAPFICRRCGRGRRIERTDPPVIRELLERPVQRNGPQTKVAGRKVEHVSHDAEAVALPFSEREENEKPVASHVEAGGEGLIIQFCIIAGKRASTLTDS